VSGRGYLLFAAMAVIWGIPYLFIKIAVAELSPATLVFARTALGAALLLPLAVARGDLRPLWRHRRTVVAYTVVEVAAPWFLLSDAERHLSSSLAGLLIAGVPLVGVVLAWITGGDDRPDARGVGGLLVGLAGVALVVGLDVATDDLAAVGEVGLVVLGYATGSLIIARGLRGVPTAGVIAGSLALTSVVYLPFGIAQWPRAVLSASAVLSVAVLGAVCTALAFLLFFALIREVGAVRATVITYFNPAVAVVLGVLVLGERFTLGIALGLALILVGSFIGTRRRRRPLEIEPAPS
jgi:drug/metabolite transporter (DMT)-like permease